MKLESNFEKIKEVGDGSQGVVGVYKDKRLGRKVAIKSLHKHLVNSSINKKKI